MYCYFFGAIIKERIGDDVMKYYFLPENGNFYKANLHSHSNWSDGRLSPEEMKNAYKEKGYSVLAITDHEAIFDHTDLNDEDFLLLPGYEREINKPADIWDNVVTCHLCFYPRDKKNIVNTCFDPDFIHPKFKWMHNPELKAKVKYVGEPYKVEYNPECINHIIEEANKNGFIVTLNHLEWSQERYEEYSQYKGMFATEVVNNSASQMGLDMDNGKYYDALLRLGNKLCCVAADDNHNGRPLDDLYSDSFGGYVMIKADKLQHEDIFSALENRNFYASTGPEINELYLEDEYIYIKTSPAKKIRLSTGNRFTSLVKAADGETVCEAKFKASKIYMYFRIEVVDENGKKAYTNAYFTEDFKSE